MTIKYVIKQLKPNSEYIFSIDKRPTKRVKSDKNGDLLLEGHDSGATEYSIISPI